MIRYVMDCGEIYGEIANETAMGVSETAYEPGPDSQASVAGASPRTTKTQFGELREALTDARKPVAGPVASQIQ